MPRTTALLLALMSLGIAGQSPSNRPAWPPEYDIRQIGDISNLDQKVLITDVTKTSERTGFLLMKGGYTTALYWPAIWSTADGFHRLQNANRMRRYSGSQDSNLVNGLWMSTGIAVNKHQEVLVNLHKPEKIDSQGFGLWDVQTNTPRWESAGSGGIARRGTKKASERKQKAHFFEFTSTIATQNASHVAGTCMSDDRLIGAVATVRDIDRPFAVHATPARKGARGYDTHSINLADDNSRFRGGRPLDAHGMRLCGWVRVMRDGQAKSVGVIWTLSADGNDLSIANVELHPSFKRITALCANGFAGIARRTRNGEVQQGIAIMYRGNEKWLSTVNTPQKIDINDHGVVVSEVYHEGRWEPVAWHPNRPDGMHLESGTHFWDNHGDSENPLTISMMVDDSNRIYLRQDLMSQRYVRSTAVLCALLPDWLREYNEEYNGPSDRRQRQNDKRMREKNKRLRRKQRRLRERE